MRHEYRLTDKGRDFFTVLAAMIRWGDRWLCDSSGPPIELRDRETGLPVEVEVVDARTCRPIDIRQIIATPGPGPPEKLAELLRATIEPGSPEGKTTDSE